MRKRVEITGVEWEELGYPVSVTDDRISAQVLERDDDERRQ